MELVVLLGESEGEAGPRVLREMLGETGPGTSDLRCAALLALAKRCHEDAHDDYAAAFHAEDAGTRSCAALALGAYGSDGLWDDVVRRLVANLGRPSRRGQEPSEVTLFVIYLARDSKGHAGRSSELVRLMRKHWQGLDDLGEEEKWLRRFWPEAAPDGPPVDEVPDPDAGAMQDWIRSHPLLAGSTSRGRP